MVLNTLQLLTHFTLLILRLSLTCFYRWKNWSTGASGHWLQNLSFEPVHYVASLILFSRLVSAHHQCSAVYHHPYLQLHSIFLYGIHIHFFLKLITLWVSSDRHHLFWLLKKSISTDFYMVIIQGKFNPTEFETKRLSGFQWCRQPDLIWEIEFSKTFSLLCLKCYNWWIIFKIAIS